MLHRNVRTILLDEPSVEQGNDKGREDLENLERLLPRDADWQPLELYLHRRKIALPEGLHLDVVKMQAALACFKARFDVRKLQHPKLGILQVFPVSVLEQLLRRWTAEQS
jgi:hypothetical protein